jgi:hypothetical protein
LPVSPALRERAHVEIEHTLDPGSERERLLERSSAGVWTRSFSHGVVFALEPGAATQTIVLPAPMKTVSGETVSSVTLTVAHGVVLLD